MPALPLHTRCPALHVSKMKHKDMRTVDNVNYSTSICMHNVCTVLMRQVCSKGLSQTIKQPLECSDSKTEHVQMQLWSLCRPRHPSSWRPQMMAWTFGSQQSTPRSSKVSHCPCKPAVPGLVQSIQLWAISSTSVQPYARCAESVGLSGMNHDPNWLYGLPWMTYGLATHFACADGRLLAAKTVEAVKSDATSMLLYLVIGLALALLWAHYTNNLGPLQKLLSKLLSHGSAVKQPT